MKSIDAIAREQNVRIEDMAIETFADPLDREDWRDQSACSGDDITLGVYDNPEWRAASFFHELGHILEDRSGRSLRPTFVPGVEVLGFWLRRGQHLYPPGGEHLRMWDYELWAWEMGLLLAAREATASRTRRSGGAISSSRRTSGGKSARCSKATGTRPIRSGRFRSTCS
jgi:hypothetical protein